MLCDNSSSVVNEEEGEWEVQAGVHQEHGAIQYTEQLQGAFRYTPRSVAGSPPCPDLTFFKVLFLNALK